MLSIISLIMKFLFNNKKEILLDKYEDINYDCSNVENHNVDYSCL